jgi:hypothetical protein
MVEEAVSFKGCSHNGVNTPYRTHNQTGTFCPRPLININKHQRTYETTITLSAITILAALALVGCNQSSPSSSTDASATNSSMNGASGTSMPSINSLPDMNTNMPAKTNQ